MITVVIERNKVVYVYGIDSNNPLFHVPGILYGYTNANVAVERERRIYVYDEHQNIVLDVSK